jgi:predicted AAA+ superfamily ATPase
VRRVIQHDLRIGERGRRRDPQLLEEVFRLACRYAGQTPTLQTFVEEISRTLDADIGATRVRQYLRFLADTLLLRLVDPLEMRLKRARGNPKICLADHGLRASWLQERIPLAPKALDREPHLAQLAGRIAESVVGASLFTISALDVAHLPERRHEPEVDFVLIIGARRIPMEVKYQKSIDHRRDPAALLRFLDQPANNAPFGVLVTQRDVVGPLSDPRIIAVPLSTLLLLR